MPPTALLEEAQKTEQMFYAQCIDCSNKQGGIVRKNKALVGTWPPIKYFRSQVRAVWKLRRSTPHVTLFTLSVFFQRLLVFPSTTRA